ncbi:MAG: hypothetical protein WCL02_01360 [bacterium]
MDELNYYKKDLGDFEIGGLSYSINDKISAEKNKHIDVDVKTMEQFILGKEVVGFSQKAENILK